MGECVWVDQVEGVWADQMGLSEWDLIVLKENEKRFPVFEEATGL